MKNNTREAGFSYMDVMVAIVILMIGILGLVSALTAAVVQTKGQEQQLSSKQIAATAMESIMTIKETDAATLGWKKVGNVGSNPDANGAMQGIFLTGFQPVKPNPGPDEVYGTADDTGTETLGYQRRIVITDICDPDRPSPAPLCDPPGRHPVRMRTVEITVSYYVGNLPKEEKISTVLTNY
jgi:type II secretory pathway pseudopilin PulG